jgi:hypothetical protein
MEVTSMIAQEDDRGLLEWLAKANQYAGGFVSSLARAGLVADSENYPILRPVLLVMRKKYPRYEPSDDVKREIGAALDLEEKNHDAELRRIGQALDLAWPVTIEDICGAIAALRKAMP